MHIEKILADLTDAVRELTAAMGAPTPAAEKPAPKKTGTSKKAAKEAKKAEPKMEATYDQVAEAFVELAKTKGKGRAACVAVLDGFNLTSLPQLKTAEDVTFGEVRDALIAARED